MKIKYFYKVAFAALFFIPTLHSCKVEHFDKSPTQAEVSNQKKIDILKEYLAKAATINISYISYSEKSEMFSIAGVEQIDLQKLTKFHELSKENIND